MKIKLLDYKYAKGKQCTAQRKRRKRVQQELLWRTVKYGPAKAHEPFPGVEDMLADILREGINKEILTNLRELANEK
ncbi:MAG: hypothetical protein DRQ40_06305 [Gammaproteobacteria bacterium]|nr:MAG: hypothetical protein DRQ40_06305 [Gammaproteobacteria bacterium]